MQLLLGLLGGSVLGGVATWFILSAKMQAIKEKTKNDLVADRASMVEQLRGKDQRIEELRQEIGSRDRTLTTYQAQLTAAARENAIAQTQLKAAQQQTAEKLTLLATAQQQFTDTFKALSSEALKANNQSFLELAQSRLGEFQTAAQGDLSLKQQAVEEVVRPLQTSLTKVETYLQALKISAFLLTRSSQSRSQRWQTVRLSYRQKPRIWLRHCDRLPYAVAGAKFS